MGGPNPDQPIHPSDTVLGRIQGTFQPGQFEISLDNEIDSTDDTSATYTPVTNPTTKELLIARAHPSTPHSLRWVGSSNLV